MRKSAAVELAMQYAAEWAVPWQRLLKVEKKRRGGFWFFAHSVWYEIQIDTGDGEATVIVHPRSGVVQSMEYFPRDKAAFLLPLWAAYPRYTSVTVGWRMGGPGPGSPEGYKYRWHAFYRNLSADLKAQYQRKFPPPGDAERCWSDFYEIIASQPARKGSIADFVAGRVP
jgi:hypothetical protein